eukprot:scpid90796/ scgid34098/ 
MKCRSDSPPSIAGVWGCGYAPSLEAGVNNCCDPLLFARSALIDGNEKAADIAMPCRNCFRVAIAHSLSAHYGVPTLLYPAPPVIFRRFDDHRQQHNTQVATK